MAKGRTIYFIKNSDADNYRCDLCQKNRAHISISYAGLYKVAICEICFKELNGNFILEGVTKNREPKYFDEDKIEEVA